MKPRELAQELNVSDLTVRRILRAECGTLNCSRVAPRGNSHCSK